MKRRDALKAIGTAAGSTLLGAQGNLEANAVRALARREGQLMQPIRVTIPASLPATSRVLVNGSAVTHEVLADVKQPGATAELEVFVPRVETERSVTVTLEGGGQTRSTHVQLEPVRQVLVYVLPHSHHDLGYTELQAKVEEKQSANIDRGIAAARKTAGYREGARFVWNLEVLWGAQVYLKNASAAKRDEFRAAVERGDIALNGMFANELTGLCRAEELVELFRYGQELGAECGVTVDSAMLSDVPGLTWGTVTAMAQAGIRYVSMAPNWFDRIGTLMVEWQDKPFWWVGPSGKERVLLWVPWTGYAMSHVVKQMSPQWVGDYQRRLDAVKFGYDISYIRWSGHGDNAEPDPEISDFIQGWSARYEWPKFRISSTSEAFRAFEKRYGKDLPVLHGDLTPYWEDGAGSSALETALNRGAADGLVQAETLFAMLPESQYPRAEVRAAWRDVLLYSEHTWGAWNSVSDSENPFVTEQWRVKREFAVDAERRARELMRKAAGADTSDGAAQGAVDVYNTTSWARTEVIRLSKKLSAAGDRVTDEQGRPLASQRLKDGELAVLVRDLAPFSRTRLRVRAGEAHVEGEAVRVSSGVLENGILRVRVDAKTGDIVELTGKGHAGNLADTSAAGGAGNGGLNQYLFLAGSDTQKLERSGPASIEMEESGPLVGVLRITSAAPGCKRLVRRLRLAAGAEHLEIANVVDKQRAALNPSPGKGGPGDDFAQRGSKESIQFAFPFAVAGGEMRVNMPLSVVRPERDQLPGACKNWLPVSRWVDVSNGEHGVTWVSLDAPLIEVGEVSATMLGSQRDPQRWRKTIAPTQKLYSWVMNNHWGTNYRAYQEGPVEFRYAVWPHAGFDAAASSRLAIGLSQGLLAYAATAERAGGGGSMLRITPDSALVLAMERSADGKALMIRLLGAGDGEQQVALDWGARKPQGVWKSNLREERLDRLDGAVALGASELLTIRAEFG